MSKIKGNLGLIFFFDTFKTHFRNLCFNLLFKQLTRLNNQT